MTCRALALAFCSLTALAGGQARAADRPEDMRRLASEYYAWLDRTHPVASSERGLHTWDDRLTDYSAAAIAERRKVVSRTLQKLRALKTAGWGRDDQVDFILLRSQIEGAELFDRILHREDSDPQLYVGECADGVFTLLKKEYAPRRTRALAATERLDRMPALLAQARRNLTRPVRLHAELAIAAARSSDDLFRVSLMALDEGLPAEERSRLIAARDRALEALHAFAGWLEARLPGMPAWKPMGRKSYDTLLHRAYLLPLDSRDVAMLGETELARWRALESWLPDPSLASPDPARSPSVPRDQEAFLAAYQGREREILDFLEAKHLVTLPRGLGPFLIRRLPEAFKPTSPGGFMNPPGLFDADPSGFFFIPTYDPRSENFYIRAAIEEPRPILGHEGIPGHFLQISIANHVPDEIRRRQDDGVFVEGWALYGEEMLLRSGFYPPGSAGEGQVLRLARYRAARIGVDVNLHTGRWTFEEAVRHFMEAGGLDREAARGEAAGAASTPTQKITYMVGKWQIMRLLGRWRDRAGASFRLGDFHDRLLAQGSLPLSVVEWLMLDDDSDLRAALGQPARAAPGP